MNTFYTIISAVTNPNINEKISVGLILSDGNETYYDFSSFKLNSLTNLMSSQWLSFLRKYLKNIKYQLNDNKIDVTIDKKYYDYLSAYNNNIVSFSEPRFIDLDVNRENFNKLFSLYISNQENQHKAKLSKVQETKNTFIPKVKKHFSIDNEINANYDKQIKIPLKIDLIGKNDTIVLSKFFDLERKSNFVKSDFYDLNVLSKVFDTKTKKFLVTAEPDKKNYPEHHSLWSELRSFDNYTYVDVSEIEIIKDYAQSHGVEPLVVSNN
jgi:hypothetical protein